MHIISRTKLRQFSGKHAEAVNAINTWYKIASKAEWKNLAEVQAVYSQAEAVGNFTLISKVIPTV